MNITKSIGMNGIVRLLTRNWGRRTVIGIPYGFLILFFSVPFLVVLKISVSSTDELGIHFQDLISYADGIFQLKIKLSNYIFLTTDPLYIETYWSSVKFAAINTLYLFFDWLPIRLFHGEIACQHAAGSVDDGVAAFLDLLFTARLCMEGPA